MSDRQLDLPIAFARKTDPATSKKAAESVKNLGWSQRAVVECFKDGMAGAGMTDQELIGVYNRLLRGVDVEWPWQSESGLRTRRHELAELGVLVDTGRRGKTEAGRDSIIWGLKP